MKKLLLILLFATPLFANPGSFTFVNCQLPDSGYDDFYVANNQSMYHAMFQGVQKIIITSEGPVGARTFRIFWEDFRTLIFIYHGELRCAVRVQYGEYGK